MSKTTVNPKYQTPDPLELRRAIIRQASRDLLLALAMVLIPAVFLFTNPWAKHWYTWVVLAIVGVFVIGGTTSSLPAIAIETLPPEHSSIWTPFRCVVFIFTYLVLGSMAYVVMM